MRKDDISEKSTSDLLALVAEHMGDHGKYAATYKSRRAVVSNSIVEISLDEAIYRLILTGTLVLGTDNRVNTKTNPIRFESSYAAQSHKVVTRIDAQDGTVLDPAVASIVGQSPNISNKLVNGRYYEIEGFLPTPHIGLNPIDGEMRRSGRDTLHLIKVNSYISRRTRTTSIIKPEVKEGALPCWQQRRTFGEDMPYIEGTGQCTECSMAVWNERDSYCEEAKAISLKRIWMSNIQRFSLWKVDYDLVDLDPEYVKVKHKIAELDHSVEESVKIYRTLNAAYPTFKNHIGFNEKELRQMLRRVDGHLRSKYNFQLSQLRYKSILIREAWSSYFKADYAKKMDYSNLPKGCNRSICVSLCEKCMTKKVDSVDYRFTTKKQHIG